MMAELPRAVAFVPMCSQAGFRLSAYWVGRAERDGGAEGKIKETGTPLARFRGKPLSAHCFEAMRAAPCISACGAALSLNTLALLAFGRHRGRQMPGCRMSPPEPRP
jgi:hypothetical protein